MSLNSAMPAAIFGVVFVACFHCCALLRKNRLNEHSLVVLSGGLVIGWQGVCWKWKGRRGHHRAQSMWTPEELALGEGFSSSKQPFRPSQ